MTADTALTCPKCSTINPAGQRYCQQCGTALAGPAPAPVAPAVHGVIVPRPAEPPILRRILAVIAVIAAAAVIIWEIVTIQDIMGHDRVFGVLAVAPLYIVGIFWLLAIIVILLAGILWTQASRQ